MTKKLSIIISIRGEKLKKKLTHAENSCRENIHDTYKSEISIKQL